MRSEISSDVVCPWCFVGKRNLDAALARFEHRDAVEVLWRSFELDPGAPPLREGDYLSRLARKYGVGLDQARAMVARIERVGSEVGIAFRCRSTSAPPR